MNKSQKNILMGSGITAGVVSAAAAVSHGITKKLASIAMDRPVPNVSEKAASAVSGTDYQSPFSLKRKEAAERLLKKEHELVELEARDGEHLVGHWFCRENAERIIVAMHGWRSSWADDFGLIADFLLNHGCNILFADSGGKTKAAATISASACWSAMTVQTGPPGFRSGARCPFISAVFPWVPPQC